ncbi:hypothetical protein Tco_1431642, partial [Tanacetum coccineum]
DYRFVATLDDEIRRDPERDVGYGIIDTWDKMLVGMPGVPATNEIEFGRRLTDFVTTVRQDTNEIYGILDDAQDDSASSADRDCSFVSSRPRSTGTAYGDTKTDKYTADTGDSTAGSAGTRWRSSTARDTGGGR